MLKKYSLIILTILFYFPVSSQNLFKYAIDKSVVVSKSGNPLTEPWAGGMNNPQFNEMDVNFDCVMDIVIFERAGDIVRVFINDDVQGQISYHYAPEYSNFFPEDLNNFLMVRDYNNDGKPDLFTYRPGGLKVYKNISDSTLKFELFTDLLPAYYGSGLTNVYTLPGDYLVIDDINDDGLIDILGLNVQGYLVYLYENISVDPDSFILEVTDQCWGKFAENISTDSIELDISCKGGGSPSSGTARHTGSTMLSLDLYGNGTKDLLMGDVGYTNLVRLENGGTKASAYMTSVEYHYAGLGSKVIDLPNFPLGFFMDVNNNTRKDLIVCSNQLDGGLDTGNVWLYDNFGANNNPNFQHDRDNLLIGDQVDVGTGAYPVLADISGDGLEDLIVGNIGYFVSYDNNFSTTEYTSRISYYKNVGSDSVPEFEFVTDDLEGLSSKEFIRMIPAFADLDADGDNDMLIGENNGSLSFYRNVAPIGQMADFVLVTDTFMGQFFGVQPSPFLYDIDGDNALDLLVGQKNGNIQLYLNQGDSTTPIYTLSATDTLGGIFKYYPYRSSGNAIPFIGDINGDGSNVLVVGDAYGNLIYYDGIDANWQGTYTMIDSMRVSKGYIGVSGADLTGNDSLEFIVGERSGGLMYLNLDEDAYNYSPYPRDTCVINSVWEWNSNKTDQFVVIPNPNNGSFRMELEIKNNSEAKVVIVDLVGKVVYQNSLQTTVGKNEIEINDTKLHAGAYLVQVQVGNEVFRSKIVVQ